MIRLLVFLCGFLAIVFTGCKPTEKGYQTAYDAALNKRQAAIGDLDVQLPEGALQDVDGPQLKDIDGVKIYVSNTRLKPAVEGMDLPGNYNVAVGVYKMITNCRAQADNLKSEGYQAFPAQTADGLYYTIAGSFPSQEEAVKFYQEYQKGKNRTYVGLQGAPLLIYSIK